MRTLFSVIYASQMTFFKFGDNQIIAFLNEEVVENWEQPNAPEGAEPITGYQYSGTREDGGTLLPCEDPADYGCLVNAIIRSKYSLSDEMAIQRHYNNDKEAYAAEWEEYNAFCEAAKVQARKWLNIE